jgi:hypothetical protein
VVVDDRARLVEQLRAAGATDVEIAAAEAAGALGVLAVEIAMRPDGEPLSFDGMVERAGVDPSAAAAMWLSLGLPDPRVSGVTITSAEADVLGEVVAFADALGADSMAKITRVLGASAARVGEAVVEALRVGFELPRLEQGTSYSSVVEQYTDLAGAAYPTLVQAFDFVLRRHLTAFARGAWVPSEDQRAMNLERLIGFVDLVDYTSLSATLSHGELPDLLSRFERAVSTVVTGAGGRVVKTIGDEVMFVVTDIAAGCGAAVELVAAMRRDQLPAVREGIAAGPVVGYQGDYFGEVVNLAARVVGAAEPGSVLAPAAVGDVAGADLEVSAARTVALKGLAAPVDVVRLTAR